jgi:hypothetical protein
LNFVCKDEWIRHFAELWSTKNEEERPISATADENIDPITLEKLIESIKYSKNKKAPAHD